MHPARSTYAQKVILLCEGLIENKSIHDLRLYASTHLGMKKDQVTKALNKAGQLIADQSIKDNIIFYQLQIAQYDDLYNECYKIQDFKECRQMLMQKAKIFNIYKNIVDE